MRHFSSARRIHHDAVMVAMSRRRTNDAVQTGLLSVTQTAVGCGIGLLIAGKLRRPAQKTTAATLFSVAFLLAIPALVAATIRIANRPESERGSRRRLNTIREDSG